jgi:Zn-dependent metalloprotease
MKYNCIDGKLVEMTAEEEKAFDAATVKALEQEQKIKDAQAIKEAKKTSGKQKLLDLGLTEEEVNALIGN